MRIKYVLWGFGLLMTFALNAVGQTTLRIEEPPQPQPVSSHRSGAASAITQEVQATEMGTLLPETVKSSERKYMLIKHNFNAQEENGRAKHTSMRNFLFSTVGNNFVNHFASQNMYVVAIHSYSEETLKELQSKIHQQFFMTQFRVVNAEDFDRLQNAETEYLKTLQVPKK